MWWKNYFILFYFFCVERNTHCLYFKVNSLVNPKSRHTTQPTGVREKESEKYYYKWRDRISNATILHEWRYSNEIFNWKNILSYSFVHFYFVWCVLKWRKERKKIKHKTESAKTDSEILFGHTYIFKSAIYNNMFGFFFISSFFLFIFICNDV